VEQLPPEHPEQPLRLDLGKVTVCPTREGAGILKQAQDSCFSVRAEPQAGQGGTSSPKTSSSNFLPQAVH